MFSKQFLIDSAERAISTFLQTLLAIVGVDALALFSMDWKAALAAAGSAAILSIVKSLAGNKVGNEGTASLTKATLPAPLPIKVDVVADALVKAQKAIAEARKRE